MPATETTPAPLALDGPALDELRRRIDEEVETAFFHVAQAVCGGWTVRVHRDAEDAPVARLYVEIEGVHDIGVSSIGSRGVALDLPVESFAALARALRVAVIQDELQALRAERPDAAREGQ